MSQALSSRRQMLAGAMRRCSVLAGVSGALMLGDAPGPARAAGGVAGPGQPAGGAAGGSGADPDGDLLIDVAAVETLGIAIYETVLPNPLLSPPSQRTARRVLSQERAHVRLLGEALGQRHRAMPAVPAGAKQIDDALSHRHVDARLEDLHKENDCLDLLLDVEALAEGAYYYALSKLQDHVLLELACELLASEAQHEALIGQLRQAKDFGRAAPYAFVEGIR